ncbi:MAG: hypothetical protein D3916_08500 [Candidatus Electrothrix sp. MAN1_4]|nr:hypothetical protein [Candidatus Electrothrix sp. MAN1_4]
MIENKRILILDGRRDEDTHLDTIYSILLNVLGQKGNTAKWFTLRDITLKQCIGCFHCWIATPGQCIHRTDAGSEIIQNILESQILLLFTPVVFGGYSSEIKKIIDRLLPLLLPFFRFNRRSKETHHPLRYITIPSFVAIGVQAHLNKEEAACFRLLIERNAINYNAPSYAVQVVNNLESEEKIKKRFRRLVLENNNHSFLVKSLTCSDENKKIAQERLIKKSRNILFIIGSPKIKTSSTSTALADHLARKINQDGLVVELWPLAVHHLAPRNLKQSFLDAINVADSILIIFPLYFDSLPYILLKTIEHIYSEQDKIQNKQDKYLAALVNNGFPEAHQNTIALTICQNFAMQCGMIWGGGVGMGAGEALINGQPLTGNRGFGGFWRPSLYSVDQAMNMIAKALIQGSPISGKTKQLLARQPVPFISYRGWQFLFIKIGNLMWKREARKNRLRMGTLFDKPYEKTDKMK